eukprot:UN00025
MFVGESDLTQTTYELSDYKCEQCGARSFYADNARGTIVCDNCGIEASHFRETKNQRTNNVTLSENLAFNQLDAMIGESKKGEAKGNINDILSDYF